jgi:hypothetical protein
MKAVPLRRTTRFTILCRRRHDSIPVGAPRAVIMRTKTIEVGMTQTDNRGPGRPTTVTERAATPGGGAGRTAREPFIYAERPEGSYHVTPQDPEETQAAMWRKRRMQLFLMNDMQRCSTYPDHVAYHEAHALRSFCEFLESSPDKPENVELAFGLLSDENRDHLRGKFSQYDFQSTSEWIRAIQNEVTSVLLPEAERGDRSVEVVISRDAQFFTQEVVKHELAVDERIDAMTDRAIKRLVQAKAFKQMLGSTCANGRDDQFPSNKPNGPANSSIEKPGPPVRISSRSQQQRELRAKSRSRGWFSRAAP